MIFDVGMRSFCVCIRTGTLVYDLIQRTFVGECAQNLTPEKLPVILDFPAVGVFFLEGGGIFLNVFMC